MTHDEIRLLVAAQAIDALDPDETEIVRRHLETCAECRADRDGFERAAAALGTEPAEAPPEIWDRIVDRLHEATPPGPPLRLTPALRPRGATWTRPALAASAAAVAVALALLGWDVARLDSKVSNLQTAMSRSSIAQAADAAGVAPDSHLVKLQSSSGAVLADVAIRPGGQAYVYSSSLSRLSSAETYQLWGLAGTRLVSLGLLGPTGSPAAFRLGSGITALMITAEPSQGVVAPTTPVLARGAV